jgi:histidine ammonia-lyase
VLAVEALCAAAGLDFRAPLRPSPHCARLLTEIREVVPPFTEDRPPGPAIEALVPLLLDGRVG